MDPAKTPLTEQERENLVAFLDGELDSASAQKLEAKLHLDAGARAEADQLKRAWDLLDYLPRPEASPNFTHKTLERVSALRVTQEAKTPRRWAAVLSRAAAVLLALGAGFAVVAAVSHWAQPGKQPEQPDPQVAQELRLLENLPAYQWLDDVQQLGYLDQPDLFGDETPEPVPLPPPVVSNEPVPEITREELEQNRKQLEQAAGKEERVEQLTRRLREFKNLPKQKQDNLRKLDRDLNEDDAGTRNHRLRIMTRYVGWLQDLPENERKKVQAAEREEWKRLVKELRDQEWLEKQPPGTQKIVREKETAREQAEVIARLRQEDREFRLAWQKGQKPSGEQQNALRAIDLPEEVQNFVHNSLVPLLMERDEKAYNEAVKRGGAFYVRTLVELTDRYAPASTSPQRPAGKADLPQELRRHLPPKDTDTPKLKELRKDLNQAEGKWPDYGIAVLAMAKQVHPKFPTPKWARCRYGEFEPAVQAFLTNKLFPVLTGDEKKQLDRAEGEWPDYHRTMIKLAQEHGLQVPGMSLPGAREFWDRLLVSLPEENEHVLLEFAATQMNGKELTNIQFSVKDRAGRERLKEAYYRRNPERLQKRLLEDYQALQKKAH